MSLIIAGILVGIGSQAVSALGLVLQKRAHSQNGEKEVKKKWFADPKWLFAFAIFICGNLANIVALTLGTQSVIASLVVLSLVFNAIFASLLLKGEKVQPIDILGIFIIIVGIVLVVVFGPKNGVSYTTDELLNLWTKTPFVIYYSIVFAAVLGLIVLNHIVEKRNTRVDESGKPVTIYRTITPKEKLIGFSYAILPAILSSFNALFSKVLGEIILKSIKEANQFVEWSPYFFIFLFAIVDGAQVVYLQRALRSYSALFIVPLYQSCLTIFGVATGGIYFEEFNEFRTLSIHRPILFTCGLLIAIAGVAVLSKRKSDAAETQSLARSSSNSHLLTETDRLLPS